MICIATNLSTNSLEYKFVALHRVFSHSNAQDPFQSMHVVTAMIYDIISCYCMPTAVVQRVHSNTDSWHCNECFLRFPVDYAT